MDILILGGGGREHALARAIRLHPECGRLVVAPGNAGIAAIAECAPLPIEDGAAVAAFAKAEGIGLVVVGPEAPLAAGAADALMEAGIPVFGPSRAAAMLEASKGFTKEICAAVGAPTAAYGRFSDLESARAYLRAKGAPIVVKADGLAAGKGVTVAETMAEAEAALDAIFAGAHGAAEVVIEEVLRGEEASFFVLCDGARALPLGSAQDHKRAFDGDEGPNTGGMGAYSPAPVMTAEVEARAMREIVEPCLAEMARRGAPFRGVLFVGLMIEAGVPRLVEFNVRFGDPECQALTLRLGDALLPLLLAAAEGRLPEAAPPLRPVHALAVTVAAKGYPGDYAKGEPIRGLDAAGALPGVTIFHAGTARDGEEIVSNGGRVLTVTAKGETLAEARARAYAAVDLVDWPGGFCRRDIGWRALGG
ncbi:MAG: phosphoribosylamine--glycine ligase [Pikeienuella sp.]|uniref:phosphoribosylamine--glycine ligase n=1 Tax=Pikeienuella sp. TaxID=2831957 RepID=UPI0039190F78